jgi:hypothetical protein
VDHVSVRDAGALDAVFDSLPLSPLDRRKRVFETAQKRWSVEGDRTVSEPLLDSVCALNEAASCRC